MREAGKGPILVDRNLRPLVSVSDDEFRGKPFLKRRMSREAGVPVMKCFSLSLGYIKKHI